MSDSKTFPIQGGLRVSWVAAERAYAAYSRQSPGQSLEKLARRSGFGLYEFVVYYQGKTYRADPTQEEIAQVLAEVLQDE